MKWVSVGDKHVSGCYQIYRVTQGYQLYCSDAEGYRAINRNCESLSAAKSLAQHDLELRIKAEEA